MAVLDLAHTENLELANLIAEKARLEALKMLDGVVELKSVFLTEAANSLDVPMTEISRILILGGTSEAVSLAEKVHAFFRTF